MIRKKTIGFALCSAAFVCAASFAFGQSSIDDDCRVRPPSEQSTQQQQAPAQDADGSLTEKLDDCNGVLKPPLVGDQEIAEPPPDVGETPVIKPGEIPPQPPRG